MNIPFWFQKSNKGEACEDAPARTSSIHSVICDGLGGAGATKHTVWENNEEKTRTSGYLGARIVSDCVVDYYTENAAKLFAVIDGQNKDENVLGFLGGLKGRIVTAFEENMQKWQIEPSHGRTFKDFPTTLASAMYYPRTNGITILAVWAGDSRVYALTPQKGLQLLSLDDALNAENEMNSTSEMTNCISAGNDFRLNYAFYELNGPGIIFCCSDGCFDYLPSPLHFEWLMLHTIVECMPDSDGGTLGEALAESIRDHIYESIGDDTTMAGIIVGMDSASQMKSLYQDRMCKLDQWAVGMNERLKDLKAVQNEKDAAQKKCRLSEEKIFLAVRDAVCKALQLGNTDSRLHAKLMDMPCYAEYARRERAIDQKIAEERAGEIQKLKNRLQQTETVCRNMLICDYLKSQQQADGQRGNTSSFFGVFRPAKPRESVYGGWENTDMAQAKQSIQACIEMYGHPYFREVVPLPKSCDDAMEVYIQSQIERLEAVGNIFENQGRLFENLWSQAYYSTESFKKDRARCVQDPQLDMQFKQAMGNPQNCRFVSELSMRKIAEYRKQKDELVTVQEKYGREKQRRLANLQEEFWKKYRTEILEAILSENETTLRNMFRNTVVPMEQLLSYSGTKKALGQDEDRIADIQRSIDQIWDLYRTDYQLFKQATEKGVC